MDNDAGVPGFGMQAVFLAEESIAEPGGDQGNGDKTAQVHTGQCADQTAQDQAPCQGADAPINKFALEAAVNKGLLQPLINCILSGH